jgi:hypothetical protein
MEVFNITQMNFRPYFVEKSIYKYLERSHIREMCCTQWVSREHKNCTSFTNLSTVETYCYFNIDGRYCNTKRRRKVQDL